MKSFYVRTYLIQSYSVNYQTILIRESEINNSNTYETQNQPTYKRQKQR